VANVVEFGARNSIEHQARKWLIRMDGDEPLSNTEKEALREWMRRSASHRGELTRVARFWDRANILTELPPVAMPPPVERLILPRADEISGSANAP
jgi:ferric-dicitrate binding protein FerR (iron transport regulator)